MHRSVLGRGVIKCLFVAAVCILLNFLAPLVDNQAIRQNAAEAVDSIWNAGASQQIVGGFENARLDDYTAVLILKTACFTGDVPYLDRVFGGLRIEQAVREDTDEWGAYCTYVPGEMALSDDKVQSYSRYWHGYIFPLRLLMSIMSYSNVKMLCYMLEMVLFAAIVILAYQRQSTRKAVPGFILTFLLLMPTAMGTCANYIPCVLIALVAGVLVLRSEKPENHFWIMGGVGIVTSFMDLLTFPVITLIIPMTFWLCFVLEREARLFAVCKAAILSALCWGIGYAGMWALKWGINGLLYGSYVVYGVFQQILLRSSTEADGVFVSRFDGIRVCLRIILNKPVYGIVLGAYLAGQLLCFARGVSKNGIRPAVFCLLIPTLIPVVWITLTTNHAVVHAYYVYRSLWVALFPLLTVFALQMDAKQRVKAG
ncbi:MAG: hypothetical protein IJT77_11265 [Clostridia bacterium]|nr:hypothetical protein [Clostridia bacterium]